MGKERQKERTGNKDLLYILKDERVRIKGVRDSSSEGTARNML